MGLFLTNRSNYVPEDKRHYIGIDKPKVEIMIETNEHWEGKLYSEWELEIIDGDVLRIDSQGWDNEPDDQD